MFLVLQRDGIFAVQFYLTYFQSCLSKCHLGMINVQKDSHQSCLCFFLQVYIIAHIPVGYLPSSKSIPAMREYYNEKLLDIFRKYSSIIAGQFYGHTHRDSIMVLSDKKGKMTFCLHLPNPRC